MKITQVALIRHETKFATIHKWPCKPAGSRATRGVHSQRRETPVCL